MGRVIFSRSLLAVLLVTTGFAAQPGMTSEQRANQYLQALRQQPSLVLAFLREMPKGGDLHNHLAGAIYAESWIRFASEDGLCVDRSTATLLPAPCDDSCDATAKRPAVRCSSHDQALYNQLIDAWSMRNWERGHESGHDHFFATFDKFRAAGANHTGQSIAEAAQRAAADHVQYLELMHTADGMQAAQLGAKLGWMQEASSTREFSDDEFSAHDFAAMRERLLSGGLPGLVVSTRQQLDKDEAEMRRTLSCDTSSPAAGCDVTVRYLYQVLRGLPSEDVFAQILLGFELASADPRFAGLNLVMPEDWYVPMRDFDLHMRMLDYLHGIYPKVHISLHAGELAFGMVPPEGLSFHIRESIEVGHAERIGHGVDVVHERDPLGLLREMANRNVLVEICLTSNDVILGVKGGDHSLPVYRKYGVPVALATDDEGVSRSDMTHEYERALETYNLSYLDLKRMARQSLEHSFLPGASLWADARQFRVVKACPSDAGRSVELTDRCRKFLESSEKARQQWKLEEGFAKFEKKF